jgi:hypothetical protein
MTDAAIAPSEREKWEAEQLLKREELALKRRELDVRESESKRARWSNPLVLAVAGAALAAAGNVIATFYTGIEQRRIEGLKHEAEQKRERERAESQLILEVVKTPSPDKAAENLDFLVRTSLINDETRRKAISNYVSSRAIGSGISLPAVGTLDQDITQSVTFNCVIQGITDVTAMARAIDAAVKDAGISTALVPNFLFGFGDPTTITLPVQYKLNALQREINSQVVLTRKERDIHLSVAFDLTLPASIMPLVRANAVNTMRDLVAKASGAARKTFNCPGAGEKAERSP